MITYPVVEKFVSINGEGQKAGEIAAFIRMRGCNLACNYCDTSWANTKDCPCEFLSAEELITWLFLPRRFSPLTGYPTGRYYFSPAL